MAENPRGAELIVSDDLNVDLEKAGGRGRDEDIVVVVAMSGLEYLAVHFFPRRRLWCRYRRTWAVVRQGRVVRSRTDYILGSDRLIFQNMALWDPRHNSDHFMVVGCLRRASLREHSRYFGRRTCLPLRPPGRQTRKRADKLFAELRRVVPKPYKHTERHNSWISAETFRLVDKIVSTSR